MSSAHNSMIEPVYRALIMTPNGDVINIFHLIAGNVEEAIALTKAIANGHAVELWDGVRFVEYFDTEL